MRNEELKKVFEISRAQDLFRNKFCLSYYVSVRNNDDWHSSWRRQRRKREQENVQQRKFGKNSKLFLCWGKFQFLILNVSSPHTLELCWNITEKWKMLIFTLQLFKFSQYFWVLFKLYFHFTASIWIIMMMIGEEGQDIRTKMKRKKNFFFGFFKYFWAEKESWENSKKNVK